MSKKTEEAVKLFKEGYNCCQSVFGVFAEEYGVEKEVALKLATSFGAGFGRMREVCGAFSGMCLVAGMETGVAEAHDQQGKAYNYTTVQQLAEDFKAMSGGSIICKELLGLSQLEHSPIPDKRTEQYYKKRPCIELVENAVRILEETLANNKAFSYNNDN